MPARERAPGVGPGLVQDGPRQTADNANDTPVTAGLGPRPLLVTVPLDVLLTLIDFTAAMNAIGDDEDAGHIALAWAVAQHPAAVGAFVAAADDLDLVEFLAAARQLLAGPGDAVTAAGDGLEDA